MFLLARLLTYLLTQTNMNKQLKQLGKHRKRIQVIRDENGYLLQRGDLVGIPSLDKGVYILCYSTEGEYYYKYALTGKQIKLTTDVKELKVKFIKR